MAENVAQVPVLLVLAGPAGSGKSTLCDRMVAEAPDFHRVVTATTREPRAGEINGVHYHFLTPAEFDARVAAGAFLEWAWVHKKNRYGTLAADVVGPLRAGRSLIINIDVQGVENFRRAAEGDALLRRHMTTVFVDVPIPELRKRLAGRGTDGEEEIARRMQTAELELAQKDRFDRVIVSRSKDEDFAGLLAIWREAQQRVQAQA